MIAGRADVARASDQIGGREGRMNRSDRWAERIRNLKRMTIARVVIRIATSGRVKQGAVAVVEQRLKEGIRKLKRVERTRRKIKIICEEEPLNALVQSSVYPVRFAASRQTRE